MEDVLSLPRHLRRRRRATPGDCGLRSRTRPTLAEIRELLAPYGLEAVSAGELGLAEPAETGTTFEENAYTKAFAAALHIGCGCH